MIVDLSERILYLIESKGVTVYEVSLVTGISQASLSRIINKETNKLQLKNINLLANYFNISPDWLRSGNGEMLLSNNINNTPEFYVDFQPFNDCTAYLPIYGDSMYPHFTSGEIVAVKKVSNHDIILWGEAYLIITDTNANNMKTVKLLYPHEDEDKIILRASNPEYKGDTIIPKSSILNLYIVKGKITRKQL
jgi:transcriptional regulator with XRE-family HTH domain